jgi:hypothetical protein
MQFRFRPLHVRAKGLPYSLGCEVVSFATIWRSICFVDEVLDGNCKLGSIKIGQDAVRQFHRQLRTVMPVVVYPSFQ